VLSDGETDGVVFRVNLVYKRRRRELVKHYAPIVHDLRPGHPYSRQLVSSEGKDPERKYRFVMKLDVIHHHFQASFDSCPDPVHFEVLVSALLDKAYEHLLLPIIHLLRIVSRLDGRLDYRIDQFEKSPFLLYGLGVWYRHVLEVELSGRGGRR